MSQYLDADVMAQIFDKAELVRVNTELQQIAVWHGGITINIYDAMTLNEITCFSLSDEKGRPEDRDAVAESINRTFQRTIAEREEEY